MIFTILPTLWNSEQKNGLLIELFWFSSDFDEIWWSCSTQCVLQFHQVSSKSDEKQKNQMKNKKVLLIAHFSVQNFNMSAESWKSYIVRALAQSELYNSDITCQSEEENHVMTSESMNHVLCFSYQQNIGGHGIHWLRII